MPLKPFPQVIINGHGWKTFQKKKKKIEPLVSLRTGFEPVREDPIGFQVQRLNHSAIAAVMNGGREREKTFLITTQLLLLRCIAGYYFFHPSLTNTSCICSHFLMHS